MQKLEVGNYFFGHPRPVDGTRKVGRPAVPDDKMRKNRTFKTTDGEWEQIKALARKSGMTTSEYIRERVLKTQE